MNKEFEVDGKKYQVKFPSQFHQQEARKLRAKEFNRLLKTGEFQTRAEIKKRIDAVTTKEEKAEEESDRKKLHKLEEKLSKGGYDADQAIQDSLEAAKLRDKLVGRGLVISAAFNESAESFADALQFDYLVSVSILTEDGKPVCKDVNDYLQRVGDDEVLSQGTLHYQELTQGSYEDLFNTIEKQVLKALDYKAPEPEKPKPFIKDGKEISLTDESKE